MVVAVKLNRYRTLSINLARVLEEEAMKTDKPLTVYLPVKLATYLLNEQRELVKGIEERQKVSIKVVPDNTIEGANYLIDKNSMEIGAFKASVAKSQHRDKKTLNETSSHYEEALVKAVTPKTAPPKPSTKPRKPFNYRNKSMLRRIVDFLKSLIGIKPKKFYKGRQFNGRRRYNNKNNYSKYNSNNKYKSFNKKKPYYNKNNSAAKKPQSSPTMKENKSD